jgi:hypothetical protein
MNFGRTLLSNHLLSVWGEAEHVDCLHPSRFAGFDPSMRPYAGWLNALGLGYRWVWGRPDTGFGVHPTTGVIIDVSSAWTAKWLGSGIDRIRLLTQWAYRQELPWGRHVLKVGIGTRLEWGDQPIQEWLRLRSGNAVRASSSSRIGDCALYGTLAYRLPLVRDLGLRIPIFYFERFAWAFWWDWEQSWGRTLDTYDSGKRLSLSDGGWKTAAGIELRSRVYLWGKLPVLVRVGYGWDIYSGLEGRGYWVVGPILLDWMPWHFKTF